MKDRTFWAFCAAAAVALVVIIIVVPHSRCPLCTVWLDPRCYPSTKRHCPNCGRKMPEDFDAR